MVPVKFSQVVMSACHISPLSGNSHEHRTLLRILAHFWGAIVNKEVAQFIRACKHCELVNSCSYDAQQLLHTIESNTPFDVVFLDFWEPGSIPYWDLSCKILTCVGFMTGIELGTAIGMKEITSDQDSRIYFRNFSVMFGLPKMIVAYADGFLFLDCSRRLSKRP